MPLCDAAGNWNPDQVRRWIAFTKAAGGSIDAAEFMNELKVEISVFAAEMKETPAGNLLQAQAPSSMSFEPAYWLGNLSRQF